MNKNLIIAIDGPVGSGKSTVAKLLAERLGYLYIDTGAMYRAITLKIMRKNIDLNDKQKLDDLLNHSDIKLIKKSGKLNVYLDEEDVSDAIRDPEVSRKTSPVCDKLEIRKRMVTLQQAMGKNGKIVMEGRDISTVVFPDAEKKFYIDASLDERTNRRWLELKNKGYNITSEEVKTDITNRDARDRAREFGALKKHPDAIVIDTTGISPEEVVNKMLSIISQ